MCIWMIYRTPRGPLRWAGRFGEAKEAGHAPNQPARHGRRGPLERGRVEGVEGHRLKGMEKVEGFTLIHVIRSKNGRCGKTYGIDGIAMVSKGCTLGVNVQNDVDNNHGFPFGRWSTSTSMVRIPLQTFTRGFVRWLFQLERSWILLGPNIKNLDRKWESCRNNGEIPDLGHKKWQALPAGRWSRAVRKSYTTARYIICQCAIFDGCVKFP